MSCYCCSVAQSCPTLYDPMDCSTPGFSVLHHLLGLAQTHVHKITPELGLVETWKIITKNSVWVCAQWYLILCDPMDYSLPDSSLHGILQERILQQVAISYFRIKPMFPASHALTSRFFTTEIPIMVSVKFAIFDLKIK